jgi:hypothetical protein
VIDQEPPKVCELLLEHNDLCALEDIILERLGTPPLPDQLKDLLDLDHIQSNHWVIATLQQQHIVKLIDIANYQNCLLLLLFDFMTDVTDELLLKSA